MTSPPGPTVALVNTLWYGHHPMFFSLLTASFLKAGARVIGLCPDPEAATREALALAKLRGIEGAEERISMHLLPSGKRSFLNRFEGDPWITRQRWRRAAENLREAIAKTGWRADLVYFPYLDSFLRFLPCPGIPERTIGLPWSGLYLRNHHHGEEPSFLRDLKFMAKGDTLIRSPLCRGIGVLDERFNASIEAYTGKPVTSYPDATNIDLPDQPSALAESIVAKANGRKVIGLIGLEKRKGLLTMLRVAEEANRRGLPWFFVLAGTFGRDQFNEAEQRFIDGLLAGVVSGSMDNLHFDPAAGRIGTDADFNSLFTTFHIAWTAYEGFHGSSGVLSKAAEFDMPAIATAGECIGSRVETHRIGLTIPEGDSAKALEAIERILGRRDWNDQPLEPDYEGYRNLHSQQRMDGILAELVWR